MTAQVLVWHSIAQLSGAVWRRTVGSQPASRTDLTNRAGACSSAVRTLRTILTQRELSLRLCQSNHTIVHATSKQPLSSRRLPLKRYYAQISRSAYQYLLQLTNTAQEVRKAYRTHLLCSYHFASDVAGVVPAVVVRRDCKTSQPLSDLISITKFLLIRRDSHSAR